MKTQQTLDLHLPTSIIAWLRANLSTGGNLADLALRLPPGWGALNGRLLTPEGRAYII